MELEFEVMTPEDFNNCSKVLMLAFKENPWNENWTYEQSYSRITELMSSEISRGYIIKSKDKIVSMLIGRVTTYLNWKEFAIDEISVLPDYQGLGIGNKMLEAVKSKLQLENINYMTLNTKKGYPCVDFYKKNGFKQDDSNIFMVNKF